MIQCLKKNGLLRCPYRKRSNLVSDRHVGGKIHSESNDGASGELYGFVNFSIYSVILSLNLKKIMIPLSEPYLNGNEWQYVRECLDSGWLSTSGEFVNRFEAAVVDFTGIPHAVAMNSGTIALEIALRLSGVQPGDYVLVPNLTFVASLNAICHLGALPLLVDVDAATWQMDLDLLATWLGAVCERREMGLFYQSRRISAMLPVHVLGNIGNMDQLMALAAAHDLPVVEDATEAIGTTFQGRHAGGFGRLGCLSFNANKLMTTGGGGMILTHDAALATQARHLSLQAKLAGGEYLHDAIGYNCRMTALTAAIGLAQLEQLPDFLTHRRNLAARYREELSALRFQQQLPDAQPNHWLTTVYTADKTTLIDHLASKAIQNRPLWVPMNQLPMFQHLPYLSTQQVSQTLYDHCVSLPSSNGLSEAEIEQVITAVRELI